MPCNEAQDREKKLIVEQGSNAKRKAHDKEKPMSAAHAMWVVHTLFVPLEIATKAGTCPRIYARVRTPAQDPVTLVTDPATQTPIDTDAYDDQGLEYARRIAAEAVRACAINPELATIAASQENVFIPLAGPERSRR